MYLAHSRSGLDNCALRGSGALSAGRRMFLLRVGGEGEFSGWPGREMIKGQSQWSGETATVGEVGLM